MVIATNDACCSIALGVLHGRAAMSVKDSIVKATTVPVTKYLPTIGECDRSELSGSSAADIGDNECALVGCAEPSLSRASPSCFFVSNGDLSATFSSSRHMLWLIVGCTGAEHTAGGGDQQRSDATLRRCYSSMLLFEAADGYTWVGA